MAPPKLCDGRKPRPWATGPVLLSAHHDQSPDHLRCGRTEPRRWTKNQLAQRSGAETDQSATARRFLVQRERPLVGKGPGSGHVVCSTVAGDDLSRPLIG